VLGDINSKPEPQPKDHFTLERERVFAERARKLQVLRDARLRHRPGGRDRNSNHDAEFG
jgi:hypothetical protein